MKTAPFHRYNYHNNTARAKNQTREKKKKKQPKPNNQATEAARIEWKNRATMRPANDQSSESKRARKKPTSKIKRCNNNTQFIDDALLPFSFYYLLFLNLKK